MFVTRMVCQACGAARSLLRLEASLGPGDSKCGSCGETMLVPGFDKVERVDPASVPELSFDRSLASIGLRSGDVVSVGIEGSERHLEIGGEGDDDDEA
jgi:hypothetical protein